MKFIHLREHDQGNHFYLTSNRTRGIQLWHEYHLYNLLHICLISNHHLTCLISRTKQWGWTWLCSQFLVFNHLPHVGLSNHLKATFILVKPLYMLVNHDFSFMPQRWTTFWMLKATLVAATCLSFCQSYTYFFSSCVLSHVCLVIPMCSVHSRVFFWGASGARGARGGLWSKLCDFIKACEALFSIMTSEMAGSWWVISRILSGSKLVATPLFDFWFFLGGYVN